MHHRPGHDLLIGEENSDMIEAIFNFCVRVLVVLADLFGTTYKAINVWIFVILWPAFTLALIAANVWQQARIRRLLRQIDEQSRRTP